MLALLTYVQDGSEGKPKLTLEVVLCVDTTAVASLIPSVGEDASKVCACAYLPSFTGKRNHPRSPLTFQLRARSCRVGSATMRGNNSPPFLLFNFGAGSFRDGSCQTSCTSYIRSPASRQGGGVSTCSNPD